MDILEYDKIRERAEKCKYSSFTYLDYNDCEMSEIICNNDNLVLIIDSKINPNIVQYATNNYIKLIEKLKLISGNIKINFVQKEFKNHLENIGFIELCEFIDYFNDDLQSTKIKFCDQKKILYLDSIDCECISALSRKCKNNSRGFFGETYDWFIEWIKDNKVIILKENDIFIGYCCVSIYENGKKLWIREMAIDPEFQNRGNGIKLFEQALYYGKINGVEKGFLAVDKLNIKAINIYKKYGFINKDEIGELQMIKLDGK